MTHNIPQDHRLDELRAELDTNDYSHLLADAVLDSEIDDNPMVGITVRLPRNLLQQARGIADQKGTRVTTLIRHWVEQAVTQNDPGQKAAAPVAVVTTSSAISSARVAKSWNILIGGLVSPHDTQMDTFDSMVRAMTEEAHSSPIKTALR